MAHGATELHAWPGTPGATVVQGGTWFAVEAPHATRVELALFDDAGRERRVELSRCADGLHLAAFVPGTGPGTAYGYRAHGPFDLAEGHLYNPRKLLVDPWARALSGPTAFHPSQRALTADDGLDPADSAVAHLRSIVVDDAALAARAADAPPRPDVPMADSVLYECHVRGMTMHHPEVPEQLRGTYLGLCSDPVLAHLESLSVTTVSLLPVAECYDEQHLVQRGLRNYWGYAPLACFAPTRRYATAGGDARLEFRRMVDTLHAAGLEVLVDVVFNHTPEGNYRGPCLTFRGLDNVAFYAMTAESPRALVDHSGCGNSLDLSKPTCLRFVMDALRHWVVDLGVDGFRFDLAVTLARTPEGFSPYGPFLSAIEQDPVLRTCKLVAEPWDVGLGGYRLGGFPSRFAEWNDRYRDTVRHVMRGDTGHIGELATRLSGSSDLFGAVARGPAASVNFITSHDGFTLRDLVTYVGKHNQQNGEDNRDGHDHNISQNFGQEGPSADPAVEARRATAARAMLLCLSLSHGVPMLSHGDELGRTQCGNNNAYCQDNALSHVDWGEPLRHEVLPFLRRALAFRMRHACLRVNAHMHGRRQHGRADLRWLSPAGTPMAAGDFAGLTLAMCICAEPGEGVLLLVNGGAEPVRFVLPAADAGYRWRLRLDAASARTPAARRPRVFTVAAHGAAAFEMEVVA